MSNFFAYRNDPPAPRPGRRDIRGQIEDVIDRRDGQWYRLPGTLYYSQISTLKQTYVPGLDLEWRTETDPEDKRKAAAWIRTLNEPVDSTITVILD